MQRVSLGMSAVEFARGVASRSYYWLFALLLDPLDIYNERLRPEGWPEYDVSPAHFWSVLAALVLWTSILTYHDLRAKHAPTRRRRFVPLHTAARYLARDSAWAAAYTGDEGHWVDAVSLELQRALSLGEVHAIGHRELHHHFAAPGVTELKPEFWKEATIDLSRVAAFHPPHQAQRATDAGPEIFVFIEIDEREMTERWPPRSLFARLAKRSPVERIGDYRPWWKKQDEKYPELKAWYRLSAPEKQLKIAEELYPDDRPKSAV